MALGDFVRLLHDERQIVLSGSDYENGFNNGEREVGLRLQRLLCRADPEKFGLLVRENDKD